MPAAMCAGGVVCTHALISASCSHVRIDSKSSGSGSSIRASVLADRPIAGQTELQFHRPLHELAASQCRGGGVVASAETVQAASKSR